jgi:hypothetical protein
VALYSRDATWREAVAESLRAAGHSSGRADGPEQVQELLSRQSFDVLALQVRDEEEGAMIATALHGIRLPLHTILIGNANALPLQLERRAGGTFRYVPGELSPEELSRLVDVSIISGAWDEPPAEGAAGSAFEEVDLHAVIDKAASAVLRLAHRKKQTFRSELLGSGSAAYGDRASLLTAFASLLKVMIAASPERAAISAEAEARADEWLVRITATTEGGARAANTHAVEILRDETIALRAASNALREQGGMLWVELQASGLPAFALTVPMPNGHELREGEAPVVLLERARRGGDAGRT